MVSSIAAIMTVRKSLESWYCDDNETAFKSNTAFHLSQTP